MSILYPLLHNRTCGSTMYQAPCLLKSVKFIGFECTKGSFKITDERKQQIQQIPRPMTKKGMQSLLGTTVICSKFIPNYSIGVQVFLCHDCQRL